MNKQQRLLLIIFVVVAVALIVAIVLVNVSGRNAALPDSAILPTEPVATEPIDDPLAGMTEEEIAAMAMQEENHEEDYVGGFDDPESLPDITLDPSQTPEPID